MALAVAGWTEGRATFLASVSVVLGVSWLACLFCLAWIGGPSVGIVSAALAAALAIGTGVLLALDRGTAAALSAGASTAEIDDWGDESQSGGWRDIIQAGDDW